jgi:alkanesulfonate monooxygenase SsuD/methylene tetrahydromethanopterin reductase-like flavin-dependent oxidoreductase (luciferase family)
LPPGRFKLREDSFGLSKRLKLDSAVPITQSPLHEQRRSALHAARWKYCGVELGAHLPLMRFGDEPLSHERLAGAVDTARECGFAAIAANDHFVYQTAWLDGPTALASMIERSGRLALATTVALPVLRGPVPLAKALAAIDVLSEGRLVAAVGPGSSSRDYDAVGVAFEQRWERFDESIAVLRGLLGGDPVPGDARFYAVPPDIELTPGPDQPGGGELWVASWGSNAGLARVAGAGDGWLASAYNTTPEHFAAARGRLARELEDRGRDADGFPNALATMWTWVCDDRAAADRVLADVLAPLLNRDPDELRAQVCVGSAEHCAELLSRYAEAGCERVYLWPLGDEQRQLELVASEVAPMVGAI